MTCARNCLTTEIGPDISLKGVPFDARDGCLVGDALIRVANFKKGFLGSAIFSNHLLHARYAKAKAMFPGGHGLHRSHHSTGRQLPSRTHATGCTDSRIKPKARATW
jgi:hypothetical protein